MQQRALLRTAKAPTGKGSLIPVQLRYGDKLNAFLRSAIRRVSMARMGYVMVMRNGAMPS